MKQTVFTAIHKELGAKMVEFAGFEMPIQYPNGIIHEHKKVRESVGVFDVTHMGEFLVKGKDAFDFVQKVTVNDVSKLSETKIQYSAMCYEDGCVVDDLLVYHMGDHYMLVVNAANLDKDFKWLQDNIGDMDVTLENISEEINLLAVQGPNAMKTLQKITETDMEPIEFYTYRMATVGGVDMILSRTGYTGELGYELYFRGNEADAKKLWDAIFTAGEEFGIEAIGLAARDTLRLEKCYMLYGNDIDNTTNTIEAGLGWITKVAKGDFNGSDTIKKVKEEGIKRRLVGFIMEDDKLIPRHGYKIFDGDKEIGYVTSGNKSPMLNKNIGLGYVNVDYKAPETKIEIEARRKRFVAEVVKTPFVK